jgi:hypothetical protein
MKRKCEIWKAGMLKDSMGSFASRFRDQPIPKSARYSVRALQEPHSLMPQQ